MRARDRAMGLIIVAALTVSCGSSTATPVGTTTAPGTMPVDASPSGSAAVPSTAPSITMPAASSPSGSAPLPSTAVDPGLLAVLPESIGGIPVVETPEAEYGSVGDPAIARIAERLATAFVVSPSEADWAVVSVVALRPGTWSEALFRDWRDTYSAGVCEQEGGVGARASAKIGGREVHIATCGALRTYHVHLPGRDVIVSVAAVGDGRFGERMMAGLRP